MESVFTTFFNWLWGFLTSISRLIAVVCGIVWAYLEPTLPYAMLCVFAVLIDCVTAWRLNRRVRAAFPNAGADGKLKSSHMSKMIPDLVTVWLCIILATEVDNTLLDHWGNLHLGQYVAAIFVLCTVVSILENESSCNGVVWARVLQKVVANKVSRHIELTADELEKMLHDKATVLGNSVAEHKDEQQ